mgnify:CR=1 FL=1
MNTRKYDGYGEYDGQILTEPLKLLIYSGIMEALGADPRPYIQEQLQQPESEKPAFYSPYIKKRK